MSDNNSSATPSALRKKETHNFVLWLFIVAIVMFFAALTSAYLVKSGNSEPLFFSLPKAFFYTTLLLLLSSVSMHLATRSSVRTSLWLGLTMLMGLAFVWGQWQGWTQLVAQHVYLVGHPSGSFIYVISGAHVVHTLAGLLYLGYAMVYPGRGRVKRCATYWHFLSFLWLYLYVFFEINV